MEKQIINSVQEKVKQADMVLVGIGEEFEETAFLQGKKRYADICGEIARTGKQWVVPYVNYLFLKEDEKLKQAYREILHLLQGKNYFVMTYCMDGIIFQTDIDKERLVEFCGSWRYFTCGEAACPQPTKKESEELYTSIEACVKGEESWDQLKSPVCEEYHVPYEFNSLYSEHFEEPLYKENWDRYLKWLQGTLNKKLCILELGAGMRNLNTIRIRFEKVAELNLKSELIRIHESFSQLPAGLDGRGTAIRQNAVCAMAEFGKI